VFPDIGVLNRHDGVAEDRRDVLEAHDHIFDGELTSTDPSAARPG
jgi:hypothetical protein